MKTPSILLFACITLLASCGSGGGVTSSDPISVSSNPVSSQSGGGSTSDSGSPSSIDPELTRDNLKKFFVNVKKGNYTLTFKGGEAFGDIIQYVVSNDVVLYNRAGGVGEGFIQTRESGVYALNRQNGSYVPQARYASSNDVELSDYFVSTLLSLPDTIENEFVLSRTSPDTMNLILDDSLLSLAFVRACGMELQTASNLVLVALTPGEKGESCEGKITLRNISGVKTAYSFEVSAVGTTEVKGVDEEFIASLSSWHKGEWASWDKAKIVDFLDQLPALPFLDEYFSEGTILDYAQADGALFVFDIGFDGSKYDAFLDGLRNIGWYDDGEYSILGQRDGYDLFQYDVPGEDSIMLTADIRYLSYDELTTKEERALYSQGYLSMQLVFRALPEIYYGEREINALLTATPFQPGYPIPTLPDSSIADPYMAVDWAKAENVEWNAAMEAYGMEPFDAWIMHLGIYVRIEDEADALNYCNAWIDAFLATGLSFHNDIGNSRESSFHITETEHHAFFYTEDQCAQITVNHHAQDGKGNYGFTGEVELIVEIVDPRFVEIMG